jgi:hypothetical protein
LAEPIKRTGTNIPDHIAGHRKKLIVAEKKLAILNPTNPVMTRQQILDLYFIDARHKLIDLAAFMDRVERTEGNEDFRMEAFREALKELSKNNREKAKQVLLAFSDPTTKPIAKASVKGATGAWPGTK